VPNRWIDNKPGPNGQNIKVDIKESMLNKVQSLLPEVPTVLPPGNYQWPFEFGLDGNTAESVEGIPEASITYKVRVTVDRGKLAHDMHSTKHLRVIRTLESNALELMHSMSVENTWPEKIDYTIILAQKSVVFGSNANLEMRFTPLLKGLAIGDINARMVEIRECSFPGATSVTTRSHRVERVVAAWAWDIDPAEHWRDTIDETGQDGWVMTKTLPLPRSLGQCIQDMHHHGIKIRHKLKLTVALQNPDGHVSELRATLPISIFISPNIPIDDRGNLVDHHPLVPQNDSEIAAPPSYDERHLDQLYDGIDPSGYLTPQVTSGAATPFYALSRVPSAENLNGVLANSAVQPADLHRVLRGLPESNVSAPWDPLATSLAASPITTPPLTSPLATPSNSTPLSTPDSSTPSVLTNGSSTPSFLTSGSSTPSFLTSGSLPASFSPGSSTATFSTPGYSAPLMMSGYFTPNYSTPLSTPGHSTPPLTLDGALPFWAPRSGAGSGATSPQRQPSGTQSPLHTEPDAAYLSKVPSYETAVRTPAPHTLDGLPDYATSQQNSRPPSPEGHRAEPVREARGDARYSSARALWPTVHHRHFGATVMQILHRHSDEDTHPQRSTQVPPV
jgi:hypothetical protein